MSRRNILAREDLNAGRSFNGMVNWRRLGIYEQLLILRSTLMYIEAEAKMDSFQAQDGSQRTALNLLQRKFPLDLISTAHLLTTSKATSRPSQDPVSRATAVPRARLTQPTSPSAALALPRELATQLWTRKNLYDRPHCVKDWTRKDRGSL